MTFAMNFSSGFSCYWVWHFGLVMMMTCLLAALHQGAHAQQQQGQGFASLGPYEYAEMKVLCIRQDDADSSLDGNSNGAAAAALSSASSLVAGRRRRRRLNFLGPLFSRQQQTTTAGNPASPSSSASLPCSEPDARLYVPRLTPRTARADADDAEQPEQMPLVAYIHPLFGRDLEEWIEANMPMINHLNSRGMLVLVSTQTKHEKLPRGEYAIDTFQDSAIHLMQALEHVDRRSRGVHPKFGEDDWLRGKISRYAVAGYSVGGAMASWLAAESLKSPETRAAKGLPSELPPMSAAVSLGPTVGRANAPNGAREIYERLRHRVPHMLIAGTDDNMGGVDGIDVLNRNKNATRVYVLYRDATHCWIMYPFASECGSGPIEWYVASQQQAASRQAVAAFLQLYLKDDAEAAPLIWQKKLRDVSTIPIEAMYVENP